MAILRQLPEGLLDCVNNAGGGVVGKVANWFFSEASDGADQTVIAFLNQVQQGTPDAEYFCAMLTT